MNDRHNDILRIRPQIKKHQTFDNMSEEERFQNSTLRPILKLQNPLLLASFVNYATKHKGVFFDIPTDKQLASIENAVHKDQKFRNALKGMIIGQFTVEEYNIYTQNSSQLNKRMMSLVITRLQDHCVVGSQTFSKGWVIFFTLELKSLQTLAICICSRSLI